MRAPAALAAGALLVATLSGCASSGGSELSSLQRSGAVSLATPAVAASPTVFTVGDSTTETLPNGQTVTMTVGGPLLTNPIPGKPVQFATVLTETFTITATTTSSTPVSFTLADFALHRFNVADAQLTGPGRVLVHAGTPKTWKLALDQTPGQGYLIWRYAGQPVATWSFVAEND